MSARLLTFSEAGALAHAIAKDFGLTLTIKPADRDWIPTAIAGHRDGCVELFIPSRVRLDSIAFEATLYVDTLPAKFKHWQRTANGHPRKESTLRRLCYRRAMELAGEMGLAGRTRS